MQQTDSISGPVPSAEPRPSVPRRSLIIFLLVLLLVVVLALMPPLISINRFQRRVATGISLSLGRPVHLDHISLNLLPLPSLTIDNLVIDEDPAFGSEPMVQSSSVTARLRVSSLWRRQVEFSRISFLNPSINLVHTADGRWNLENVLVKAARIEAAPTGQRRPGVSPRFPYIEATGARLNLKMDREKVPFSLTEADFALWLPDPGQWRLRLKARPSRTDLNVSDTGSVQIEGTLGRPAQPGAILLNLHGAWRNAPLGEASRMLSGDDAGLRGEMTLTASIQGTVAENALKTNLHIDDLRRADFVPEHALTIDVECLGQATQGFHAVEDIRCGWPISGAGSTSTLALTGSIPDVRRPAIGNFQIGTSGIPASSLLQWMRVISDRLPATLNATGVLTGSIAQEPSASGNATWSGQAIMKDLRLSGSTLKQESLTFGDLAFEVVPPAESDPHVLHRRTSPLSMPPVLLHGAEIPLGGKDPATLDARLDSAGWHLHLSGPVVLSRLIALGDALPPFGEGLSDALPTNHSSTPVRLDLTGERTWGAAQVWSDADSPAPGRPAPEPSALRSRSSNHRRSPRSR